MFFFINQVKKKTTFVLTLKLNIGAMSNLLQISSRDNLVG